MERLPVLLVGASFLAKSCIHAIFFYGMRWVAIVKQQSLFQSILLGAALFFPMYPFPIRYIFDKLA
jgi:hypothetical protein